VNFYALFLRGTLKKIKELPAFLHVRIRALITHVLAMISLNRASAVLTVMLQRQLKDFGATLSTSKSRSFFTYPKHTDYFYGNI
jgi:hypothetical protein